MKKLITTSLVFAFVLTVSSADAQNPPQPTGQRRGGGGTPRVDMTTLVNPIQPHDSVWIEDLTQIEIRDLMKAGKTTALLFAGGMEDNGPYIVVDQHGDIVRAQCEQIARKLGNALCAPVLQIAPGDPERAVNPGTIVVTAEVFKSVVSNVITSLKSQGFKNIYTMVDHGSASTPMSEISKTIGDQWKDSGVRVAYIREYYNNAAINQYVREVLKVEEKSEGYHDDYFTAAVSVATDPLSARMPQRIKAKKTTINGAELNSPKAVEDGKKIMAFRTDMTVKAILALGK
jgi:creatinine amidohydrolase/Fe(II)-dependent formamide hydrolase-like protein